MYPAPIALFVYSRLHHLMVTVEALRANHLAESSELFIFSDGPRSESEAHAVSEVRAYIRNITGFKNIQIIERETNFGLANSIIDGVTSLVNEHGRIIVLEDDLLTSPYFLQYMNDGLNVYEQNEDVASIHGYVYPIDGLPETFFMRGADCWGWATWENRWTMFEPDGARLLDELKKKNLTKRFDFNGRYPFTKMLVGQIAGKNNSWAIRWHASVFLKNKFTLYPGKSMVHNIGNDGSGEHCGHTNVYNSELAIKPAAVLPIPLEESQHAFNKFEQYFNQKLTGIFVRTRRMIAGLLRKFN